jgi:hypothetical protein
VSRYQTRVVVVLKARDLELEADDDVAAYRSEWVHLGDDSHDELGITLEWPRDGVEMFIPWTSVLSVTRERCTCWDCRRAVEAAGA